MRAATAVITAIAITGALSAAAGAAETAEWREAVRLLRESRADRTKLVPAVRKLALLAERLPEDDPRAEQVNSMLYWAKKLMTVQEAEELVRLDRGAAGRAERVVTRRVLPSQAAKWLRLADEYAARTDDPLLKAIRYHEVADRFKGTPEGLAALEKSLELMRAAASYAPEGSGDAPTVPEAPIPADDVRNHPSVRPLLATFDKSVSAAKKT